MAAKETPEAVRLDRWLWAARLFKTRALAAAAVAGGKVHVDGSPAKASRRLRGGERIALTRGEERMELDVAAVAERRGPAAVAQALYRETEQSAAAREARREERRFARRSAPAGRPEKRDRRRLAALKRGRD